MLATLGADLTATLVAPSVLPAYPVGARIEAPYTRAILAYWRPAVLDEVTGVWTVDFTDSPMAVGEYNLVWRDSGPEPPEFEVFIPLAVVASTASSVPLPGVLPAWAPTLQQVADVTPAYTVGGFDDDDVQAGAEQATFTDQTSPTATHVEGLILAATDEVQGRVGVAIPSSQFGLAQTTAKWHVAAAIAAGKQPAGTDDASGEYRGHILNFRNSLDALISLARQPTGTRLA